MIVNERIVSYIHSLEKTNSEVLEKIEEQAHICLLYTSDNGFEDLANQVIKYIDENYEDKNFTFKVMARRARKNYPMESMEINAEMGGRILEAFPETKVCLLYTSRCV